MLFAQVGNLLLLLLLLLLFVIVSQMDLEPIILSSIDNLHNLFPPSSTSKNYFANISGSTFVIALNTKSV